MENDTTRPPRTYHRRIWWAVGAGPVRKATGSVEDLQELLDALARPETDAESLLAGLDPDTLARLETEALGAFDELRPAAENSDEGLQALEALADAHAALRAEQTRRDAANAERAARVADLSNRVNGQPDGDDNDDDDPDGDGDGGDGDGGTEDNPETRPEGTEGESVPTQGAPAEREPVLASGSGSRPRRRVDLAAARARAPRPALPAAGPYGHARLHAAADLPGVPVGAPVDLMALAKAAAVRFASMAATGRSGVRHQVGLGSITREYPAELTIKDGGNEAAVRAAIEYATDTSRLPGGSLIAAGGWCAPSETIYDIATFSTKTGLWSVPEVTVTRGGLRWPQAPDFSDIYANTGFIQTEAQNIAGQVQGPDGALVDEKPCYEIGCPDFDEVRLDAVGLCLTAGILQQKGYPEMVAAIISEALNAHAHKVNQEKIARAAALSQTVPAGALRLGLFLDLLDVLELQAEDVRYRYRLQPGAELEAVIPLWMRGALRTDLQRRLNIDEPSVADAALNARFAQRGINVQWVYDWQDAFSNPQAASDAGLFGGASPISAYPGSVDVLLYPAGTWLVANDPIITLDGIYDSVNIRTNGYTALFSEESLAVAKRQLESRKVRLTIDRRLPAS